MTKATKTEENASVATPTEHGIVALNAGHIPAHLQKHIRKEGEVAAGMENVQQDDLAIPRVIVIQSNSPQRKKGEADYVPGVEEGDLFNTLLKEKMEPFYYIDAFFKKVWTVGVDRKKDTNGGLIGSYETREEAERVMKASPDVAKLEVFETRIHGGLIVSEEGKPISPVILLFAKSKTKISKAINSQIDAMGLPRWSMVWKISTKLERNRQNGTTYFNFDAAHTGWTPEGLLKKMETAHSDYSTMTLSVSAKDVEAAGAGEPTEF